MDEFLDDDGPDIQKWIKEWADDAADWRDEARKCYGLTAGQQWEQEDVEAQEDANRPTVTFNRISALIRGVCGLEVNNRQEVRYLPREIGDASVNEILTAGAKWVRDECNAEDEESESFRDLLICGLGFAETYVDKTVNPDGDIIIERLDPLFCAWDTTAKKRGMLDGRWIATWKDVSLAEALERFPKLEREDFEAESLDAASPIELEEAEAPVSADPPRYDPTENPLKRQKSNRNTIRIVQIQYWRPNTYIRLIAPTGQHLDVPKDKFKAIKAQVEAQGMQWKTMKGREYRVRFMVGRTVLSDAPMDTETFTIKVMTGIRDRNRNCWYGLVRDLKDPQFWSNKFFSLILDILASNAKGGLLAEKGAFLDENKAEEDWSDPRKIVWLKSGGLEKLKDRVSNAVPQSLPQLMEYANNMVPQSSGVSLEFLGLTDKVQPGVLEYQRRQATIGTLAEFFSAMRLYRKEQGRVLGKFIIKYLNDGRLIRIVGDQNEQFVPLLFENPDAMDFDVVVDEAPTSPDIKGRTWATLGEVLPLAMKQGLPLPPEIFDYAPIPSSLAVKWKEVITQASAGPQIPPEMQEQIQQMQQEMEKLAKENMMLKQKKEERMAELQGELEIKQAEMHAENVSLAAKLQMEAEAAAIQNEIAILKAETDRRAKLQDMALKREAAELDAALKMQDAEILRETKAGEIETAMEAHEVDRAIKIENARATKETATKEKADTSAVAKALQSLQEQVAALGKKDDDGEKSIAFTYDATGRINGAKMKGSTVAFGYDKGGRIKGAKIKPTA